MKISINKLKLLAINLSALFLLSCSGGQGNNLPNNSSGSGGNKFSNFTSDEGNILLSNALTFSNSATILQLDDRSIMSPVVKTKFDHFTEIII